MSNQLSRYYHTIRHLKAKQIYYRLYYQYLNRVQLNYQYSMRDRPAYISMRSFPATHSAIMGKLHFSFLNQSHRFSRAVDWNEMQHGKLWNYHLNYFDFAQQDGIDPALIKSLIQDHASNYKSLQDGSEPYPTSLRIINVVKFFSQHRNEDELIDEWIGQQCLSVKKRLEFHIMGNHLLENAFALLFGAYHLQDEEFWHTARTLLSEQLPVQILTDGAHVERSPMYHNIILSRLLDSYNLISQNAFFESAELKNQIKEVVERMLSWMFHMTQGKDIMMVNDSFPQQAHSPYVLDDYAKSLGIAQQYLPLSDSGYFKMISGDLISMFDAGEIGPAYQPGHAHADTLQVLLWINHQEVLTEAGTSIYLPGTERDYERSTAAHNTVTVNELNSSDVWASFRVGRRAEVSITKQEKNNAEAAHNGYDHVGATHQRRVEMLNDGLLIHDQVDSAKDLDCKAYLHFHPDDQPRLSGLQIKLRTCVIDIEGSTDIKLLDYQYATGYNQRVTAVKAEISFAKELLTKITKRA